MDTLAIFGLQFFLSLVVWGLIAKWLLAPRLETKSPHQALFFLTLPHAFRYLGLVFLVPGVVARPLVTSSVDNSTVTRFRSTSESVEEHAVAPRSSVARSRAAGRQRVTMVPSLTMAFELRPAGLPNNIVLAPD